MKGSQKKKPTTAQFQGYVPVYLDEKTKKHIKANIGTLESICDKFVEYAEDDYRITIGWDAYNECMSASLYDTKASRATGGYILSAKHADLRVALTTLVYLHEEVYRDGWNIEHTNADKDINW